jgi:hypothetical protein
VLNLRYKRAILKEGNMTYKAEFSDDHGKSFASNALVFETESETERYAKALFSRWLGATNWRIATSTEKANYRADDHGNAEPISDPKQTG